MAGVESVFVYPAFRFDGTCLINCSSMTAFSFSINSMRERQCISDAVDYSTGQVFEELIGHWI